ncbi:type II toxin-antitoxin system HicB family antitoxin [Pseudidiomarina andamanensis]|uniref:Type II toxin-antitoxin system HicB family antitoxin n=1 Tax=Pseudidiomarina andamanensis TaxID=1940690 RepID=A0AA92ES99_9GAMM|nr:type II toxin-antitoxin system HicB family antitoxin [Pseudidiomarina andamanensis]MDS0219601.1 type II toxin-antitoxin system HicB family antitoxin [Pseudidiomarina andamanensis]QGT95772.1 type II toxin-antitoxin system HicB family antitoxin [Pseudidiomarina andamanensis]
MKYPVSIEKDGQTFMARFVDIPEALTCGDTYEEALQEAQDALLTAFEFYFEDQRPVPMPSPLEDRAYVTVPASVWAKVLLLNTMLTERVTQAELAKRIGSRKQEMQRIINLGHNTKIDTLNKALEAMGKHLNISVS